MRTTLLIIIASLAINKNCFAQLPEPGFETTELIRLSEVYRLQKSMSFQVHYHFADSALPGTILDQYDIQYQLSDGRYTAKTDSMEIIGGYNYTLQVFFDERLMVMSSSSGYTDVLQLPLIDSLFLMANVDSVRVQALSDSTNKLSLHFGSASSYSGYQLFYNTGSYLIDSVKYYIKEPASDDPGASPTSVITAEFSNYTFSAIDENCFNIGKYVYFEEVWRRKGDYFSFTLVDPQGNVYLDHN